MLRVLVVDDCPDTVTSLQLLLRSWGHETRIATDGLTALDLADGFQPDVVVLDIALPGMDGYEVAKRLGKPNSEKPIIIAHSGYSTEADVRRSLKAGFAAHLAKPVAPEDIRKVLIICENWLHLNPPAQREHSSKPTASLPARPDSEA
jgi:CheY-like chemotaxis protein